MIVHMQCFVHVLSDDHNEVVWFGERGHCHVHWAFGAILWCYCACWQRRLIPRLLTN